MYFADQIIENCLSHWQESSPGPDAVLMVLLGEHSDVEIKELIEALNEAGIPFFGGLFPRIISDITTHESGAIVRILPARHGYALVQDRPESGIDESELESISPPEGTQATLITLVDGLMKNIPEMLTSIHNRFGEYGSFFGGGAGSLSLQQAPCLFCNKGFYQDAAIVCLVDQSSKAGVRHGWEKLHGPLVATKTDRNTIYELNWQNAFEVYHQIVSEDVGHSFDADHFFDTSKGYPFGIYREGAEDIVRDPIAVTPEGGLVCVGAVPENAVLHILKGQNKNLIASARQAGLDCKEGNSQAKDILLADCISRVIFLEEHFPEELKSVREGLELDEDTPLEGMLSLGEISSFEDGTLTFYNKTIVITALQET